MNRLLLTAVVAAAATAAACVSHDPAYDRTSARSPLAARNDAGWQRMAEGNPQAAQADFDSALQVNPFDPIALNNVAVAKSENGQYHEAVALLERANRLAPENAEIAANLSRLREYAATYALRTDNAAGVDSVLPTPPPASGPNGLPPPPPPLWSTLVRADASAGQVQGASYYYDGCTDSGTTTTSSRKNRKSRSTTPAAAGCR